MVPRLPASQAFGRFAARLAGSGADPLRLDVAGLEGRRDFVDIRDAAAAIVAVARSGRPGQVYHVGSGRSRTIGEGLDLLIRLSGRSVQVIPAGTGRGPADSRADIRRIVEQTGWSPRIDFEQSLFDLWAEVSNRTDPATLRVA